MKMVQSQIWEKSLATNKKEIRRKKLKIRREMSVEQVVELSDLIFENLIKEDLYINSKNILIYADYNHEVMTDKLILLSLLNNKCVYLPKVNGDEMDFFRIYSLDELESGSFGIREPLNIEHLRFEMDNNDDSIIIMPLAACDRKGNRIGYGKGYYDKYLSHNMISTRVGLAYDFQVVNHIDSDPMDVNLSHIATEKEVYEVIK